MAATAQRSFQISSKISPSMGFDLAPDWLNDEVKTGTTTMAVEFDGGVVIGADSRTTRGSYVANRVTDKLTPVTEHIYCCRSGSAADTQAIADEVRYELDLHESEQMKPSLVKTASTLFRNTTRRDDAMAGFIVAGWDSKEGGQVYTIPLGGMIVRQPYSIGGSGSTFIYGYCDATYKRGMSKEECVKWVSSAVALAILRDNSSGGCIRLGIVTKDGIERRVIYGDQIPKFWHAEN